MLCGNLDTGSIVFIFIGLLKLPVTHFFVGILFPRFFIYWLNIVYGFMISESTTAYLVMPLVLYYYFCFPSFFPLISRGSFISLNFYGTNISFTEQLCCYLFGWLFTILASLFNFHFLPLA